MSENVEIKTTKSGLNKVLAIRNKISKKSDLSEQIIYLTRQKMSKNNKKITKRPPEIEQIKNSVEFYQTSIFWDIFQVDGFINSNNELLRLRRQTIPEGRRDCYDELEVVVRTNKKLAEIILWLGLASKN